MSMRMVVVPVDDDVQSFRNGRIDDVLQTSAFNVRMLKITAAATEAAAMTKIKIRCMS